ncbi:MULTISPECIES: LysR substrate-binding domain-containing protein [Stenotrophomonas]|uniref:DNA-binding transcriptional LysR family regulator n=1 Tax=Stenotrophomonas rhizophila TaxID=216778 RepID=A0AAP5AHT5_9GAMM|nr:MULTISPECIES: LysR substrate-binding domain-containing protein [Stenotrophomonas]MDQ1062487.1 DNA-binding transcriptional LysR family regulator [Stenotrophomonas sp. SORGH_AS_0282]MDQ1108476.1 DNA-binding transcriptional LysR family regulator [Stenotrophomonas rhizophila]MDQ1189158.1 DNA-binding transcriptional LysR family regulator [Stenotrophomonas sp. SORGH_AS_0282]UQY86021.1 LysR substrate-binding domain-containing protein [Stenotrophomonas rhizophila]
MDRLDHLRSFLRVAELGSFTAAAEQLGLPKASVSLAVQRLEAEVGVQLLHRTTRRVRLTADGAQFQQRARDLLDDMEDLQGMFRRDTQLKGRLRVDMSSGLARQLVIPHLPDFLARHPGLEIELSGTDRRVDLVREGFDCVVRVGPLDDNTLVARPLGVMHIVNCASPAYLAARGMPYSLEDLSHHALVHYVGTLGQRSPGFEYHDGQTYRSVPMRGAITVNSGEAYSAAALAGLGIIQVPRLGARVALAAGTLVEVLPACVAEPMPVTLLYAQRRHLPRRVAAFMDWMAALVTPELQRLD